MPIKRSECTGHPVPESLVISSKVTHWYANVSAGHAFKHLSRLTGSEQWIEVGQYLLKTVNVCYMSVSLPVHPLDDR